MQFHIRELRGETAIESDVVAERMRSTSNSISPPSFRGAAKAANPESLKPSVWIPDNR
jgi:hypothetical protein